MTNQQLYLSIGVPMLFNAVLIGILIAYINAKTDSLRAELVARFDTRFDALEDRFTAINQRFDDMRDLWRAELRRVEEILDARMKHLEERR